MTNAVKIFLDNKVEDLVVGNNGIRKIFWDKDVPSRLVVLHDEGITTYTGFKVVEMKDYKEVK